MHVFAQVQQGRASQALTAEYPSSAEHGTGKTGSTLAWVSVSFLYWKKIIRQQRITTSIPRPQNGKSDKSKFFFCQIANVACRGCLSPKPLKERNSLDLAWFCYLFNFTSCYSTNTQCVYCVWWTLGGSYHYSSHKVRSTSRVLWDGPWEQYLFLDWVLFSVLHWQGENLLSV